MATTAVRRPLLGVAMVLGDDAANEFVRGHPFVAFRPWTDETSEETPR